MPINSFNSSSYDSLRVQAQSLINSYDRNGDGRLSRGEAEQRANFGTDSYSFTNRISSSYSERTTVYQTTFGQLDPNLVSRADRNGDGQVDADELVNLYLEQGNTGLNSLRSAFETRNTVETDRSTSSVYDPTTYYDPYAVRPYNPYVDGSDYYRPTPPVVVVDPYVPYHPYSPGPTPPSPNYYRPSPPPVYSPSRPTPPSSGGYTPHSSGGYSRPTPPSSGGRPPRP